MLTANCSLPMPLFRFGGQSVSGFSSIFPFALRNLCEAAVFVCLFSFSFHVVENSLLCLDKSPSYLRGFSAVSLIVCAYFGTGAVLQIAMKLRSFVSYFLLFLSFLVSLLLRKRKIYRRNTLSVGLNSMKKRKLNTNQEKFSERKCCHPESDK